MTNITRWNIVGWCLSLLLLLNTGGYGSSDQPFPRLGNIYCPEDIRDRDVGSLARYDVLILDRNVDDNENVRDRVKRIKQVNPDIILLLYTSSMEVNRRENPPTPMEVACDTYDWWLRDYEGNYLHNEVWTECRLINMTNTEAAAGSHPDGKRPNEFLAEFVVGDHLIPYTYWDGIFYDTFVDGIRWMHEDIKDANRNGVPEFDDEENGDEPIFSNLWSDGMLTLLDHTIGAYPDVVIMGNGLHKGAIEELNGRFQENFRWGGSQNLATLAHLVKYLNEGERIPRVSILNGYLKDGDATDYRDMRFTLCASLMTNAYYSIDFGSRYHRETSWYDEFSVHPDGQVDARATVLAEDIDDTQTSIPVESTAGFDESGVIHITGEQIFYGWKDDEHFHDCYRGHPWKYDDGLKQPHDTGSTVIQYYTGNKGYLGMPLGSAFDSSNPAVKLDDLFEEAGWYPSGEQSENINSRVWRRNFENGAALVNPTETSTLVYGLGQKMYRLIDGIQDPVHNSGEVVHDTLRVPPGDGYVLLWISEIDTIPPAPPEGLHVKP